jgi:serine/threonine-protein kinase
VREQPPHLESINASIPIPYIAITAKALAKAPSDRYPTAEELRADLLRFTNGQKVLALQSPVTTMDATRAQAAYSEATRAVPTVGPATTASRAATDANNGKKGVLGPLLLLLSLIAIVVVALILFLRWGTGGSNDPVTIPAVVGKSKADAENILKQNGLRWTETTTQSTAAKDTVVSQSPEGNAQGHKNDSVQLTLSAGPAPVTLDDYTNQSEGNARSALAKLGLNVQTTRTSSDTINQGNVISQDPRAGTEVSKGDTVTLTISTGKQKVEVPNLAGFTVSTARQALSNLGLRSPTDDSLNPSDLVARTDPPAGTQVDKSTTVNLITTLSPTSSSTSSTSSTTSTTQGNDKN